MKTYLFLLAGIIFILPISAQVNNQAPNIFIVTIDGFRWQEVFNGGDPSLMASTDYVQDTSLLQQLFGGSTVDDRRKQLLPFFWNTIGRKGLLFGNRKYDNKADVKNLYKISYAGYNEIFTGYADPRLVPNTPRNNNNINLPAYLNSLIPYKGKCVAFSSWNIFPYILNETQSNYIVNSGYEHFDSSDPVMETIGVVQDSIHNKTACRHDALTFLLAKQYIQQQHPKCVVLGFGETDEFAHSGRYDLYLQRANDIDRMIAELWYMVQTDPFYKNNSTFIITTDHGRGRNNNSWSGHHLFVKGSKETWLAMLGYGIEGKGELTAPGQIYQNQIAQTVAGLLGLEFITPHPTGKPIALPVVTSSGEFSTRGITAAGR